MLTHKRITIMLLLFLFIGLLAAPVLLSRRGTVRAPELVALASATEGFARAAPGYVLQFPSDEGPHTDFQSEWWYYTGNLTTADGRHFGYELTFFRRALEPSAARLPRLSAWATDQVYMAHFALTNVGDRRFSAVERFARGAAGLAGAQANPYRVWLEDWSIEEVSPGVRKLHAAQGDLALDLTLDNTGRPVLHGARGYSQKGPDAGNASFYYSYTRIATRGTVQVGAATYAVSGQSWMDHEWSTSALAANEVGWDWFALQLDDGSDIMLYRIREAGGSVDPFSSGTYVAPDGSSQLLARDDVVIISDSTWKSPHSQAVYPARWTVNIPSLGLAVTVEPYLSDQELNVSYVYWEGAVRLTGTHGGRAVRGNGYVEMTGYAASGLSRF